MEFKKDEIEFINFYLKRIYESYNKLKPYYATKYDVKDHFELSDKEFRLKCSKIESKISQINEDFFNSTFICQTNVFKDDLSIFLKSA